MANHEKRVTQHLQSRCVEHYLPTYSEKSKWTDRTVTLQRPLFPGYVFIRIEGGNRLNVLSTPGVIHLLGTGNAGVIPGVEIERIRTALSQGYRLQPHPTVIKGMRVRMKRGVFEGIEGRVSQVRDKCRVVLALSGVDQSFSLAAELDDIEPLPGSIP